MEDHAVVEAEIYSFLCHTEQTTDLPSAYQEILNNLNTTVHIKHQDVSFDLQIFTVVVKQAVPHQQSLTGVRTVLTMGNAPGKRESKDGSPLSPTKDGFDQKVFLQQASLDDTIDLQPRLEVGLADLLKIGLKYFHEKVTWTKVMYCM